MEHLEQKRIECEYLNSNKDYLARIHLARSSRKRELMFEYKGKEIVLDCFHLTIRGDMGIKLDLYTLNDFSNIEEFDLLIPNKYYSILKLRRMGDTEYIYLSSASTSCRLNQFDLYLGCEYEEVVAWITKVLPNQTQILFTIHIKVSWKSENELLGFSHIFSDSIHLQEEKNGLA